MPTGDRLSQYIPHLLQRIVRNRQEHGRLAGGALYQPPSAMVRSLAGSITVSDL